MKLRRNTGSGNAVPVLRLALGSSVWVKVTLGLASWRTAISGDLPSTDVRIESDAGRTAHGAARRASANKCGWAEMCHIFLCCGHTDF